MRWRKLGRVFAPTGGQPWMRTHASNPTALQLDGELFRVYFSGRDAAQRSSIGYLDLDLRKPTSPLRVGEQPLLSPGEAGLFDDSGASVACALRLGPRVFLYYVGWNLGVTVPWRNSIGLAVSEDGGSSFGKFSRAPILDRSDADPWSLSYPWVLCEGGDWRMWYGSNTAWGPKTDDLRHVIKRADSMDGIAWHRDGGTALGLQPGELGLARPCVLRDGARYRMWYSHRGSRYRIGYAESGDGRQWSREDARAGIAPSESGWDEEAVCYPCVFDCGAARYMLYNGDGYGRSGFGIAILESD
jgi:hypothetical protein